MGWGPDNISLFWSFVAKNPTRALHLPSEYDLIDIPKVEVSANAAMHMRCPSQLSEYKVVVYLSMTLGCI